jgi:glycosyltransferase involved in cell wall biosynthesis
MTTDAVGGVWTYALDLAASLGPQVETILAVLGPAPSRDQRLPAAAVPGLMLVETGLPLDWTAADPGEIAASADVIRKLVRETSADIVHLNSPALAAGGGFAAPVLGVCHSCLATWWSAVKEGPMPDDFAWRTHALWRGLIACDALAAPTRAFAQAVARTYEIPAPFMVPNGRRAPRPGTVSREPLVFTSGRLWDDGKNVATLDAAAARMSVPLYAAGPTTGPNGAATALQHARGLGLLSAEQVAGWLDRAPVFASSALYEPFGLGVLEAAQAGCALVLSDIATFRELWDGAALFVEPRDAGGFAAACERLVADPAESARLGALASRRARRFTVEAMRDAVLEVYAHLTGAAPAPRRQEALA